jgi:hypothetical protein
MNMFGVIGTQKSEPSSLKLLLLNDIALEMDSIQTKKIFVT